MLKLYTGDVIIFKSAEISHFNLHYAGKRASLVFHMDRAAKSWAKDRNGWHNIHMLSTLSGESNMEFVTISIFGSTSIPFPLYFAIHFPILFKSSFTISY